MAHEELLLFGERLRSRRGAVGLTQEYIADQAGITLRFYQMLERGEKSVSLDTLIRLSKTLSISTDYLLFGKVSQNLEDPLAEVLNSLPAPRREDALRILQLYAKSCKE